MSDVAGERAFGIDIRNMPGRSLPSVWMGEPAVTCGPLLRHWKAPVPGD